MLFLIFYWKMLKCCKKLTMKISAFIIFWSMLYFIFMVKYENVYQYLFVSLVSRRYEGLSYTKSNWLTSVDGDRQVGRARQAQIENCGVCMGTMLAASNVKHICSFSYSRASLCTANYLTGKQHTVTSHAWLELNREQSTNSHK